MSKINHSFSKFTCTFLFLILSMFFTGKLAAQTSITSLAHPPAGFCSERALCLVVGASDAVEGENLDVKAVTQLLHAVFSGMGVKADFYISDGVLGENTTKKLYAYMNENGYGMSINIVWGSGVKAGKSLGKKPEGTYVLTVYPTPAPDQAAPLDQIYMFGKGDSESLIAQLQEDVANMQESCEALSDPGEPVFIELDEVKIPQGKERKIYDGWPSDLSAGTLVVPLYPTSIPYKTGDKRADKRSEKWARRFNEAVIRKNEDLARTMKSYKHKYVIAQPGEADAYKGKAAHYMLLDRSFKQSEQVYDPSTNRSKLKSYTYYYYGLKNLENGDVYEGKGKASKSYVKALRYVMKAADKK